MILPEASARYFSGFGRGPALDTLNNTLIRSIETLRAEIREETPGGMCELVSACLQDKYGWEALNVTYLSEEGRVICADHTVIILPNGSILDGTRDQFGEGHSVSLIGADTKEIGRYRPFFFEDWHPDHPSDTNGDLAPWQPSFDGQLDYDLQDANQTQLGRGWWLADKSLLAAFYTTNEMQAELQELQTTTIIPSI
jgi:hypothetical protein